jgi:hypothetical protein
VLRLGRIEYLNVPTSGGEMLFDPTSKPRSQFVIVTCMAEKKHMLGV